MIQRIPRVLFAAPSSGSGKTTVTCSVLQALSDDGHKAMAFKCGPDYIDPMFHEKILSLPSRNLDSFLLSEETMKYLFADNMKRFLEKKPNGLAVLEGVMGYYDGVSGTTTKASTFEVARITKTPVILVVDGKGASLSIGATIKGFASFRQDSGIAGVILNRVSKVTYHMLKPVLEQETGVPLLGYMPEMEEFAIESRHLGLVTASEIQDLGQRMERLGNQAKDSIDLAGILAIAMTAETLTYEVPEINKIADVRIAIAKDEAFCFYYQDSLELLERLGAKLLPFSPLRDSQLPECDGVYLGGGYPELYAQALAANTSLRAKLKQKLKDKMPCLAECGGFMYLSETLQDGDGRCFDMVGALPGHAKMTTTLNRFGYIKLQGVKDNLLCKKGDEINGHEFHYSDSDENGQDFLATKPSGKQWSCIHTTDYIFAGYPHVHLWGNPSFAENFVKACQDYGKQKRNQDDEI